MNPKLIIGMGNPDRGDDALGPLAVRALADLNLPSIHIKERNGDGLALLEDWRGYDDVLLIDAAAPMGNPGRIHRIDAIHDPLPAEFSKTSSHGFGILEAIQLARSLRSLPARLIIYAVEGENFFPGAAPSAVITKALPQLLTQIQRELQETTHA